MAEYWRKLTRNQKMMIVAVAVMVVFTLGAYLA